MTLIERVKNPSLSAKDRGDALIVLACEGEKKALLDIVEEVKTYQEPYIRAALAQALGIVGGKEAYEQLIELTNDSELYVRCDAILGIAQTKDSRAASYLLNLYNKIGYEEKTRILNAFEVLAEPSTIDFLTQIGNSDDKSLAELAKEALDAFGYRIAKEDEVDTKDLD